MSQGRAREAWNHTSSVLALLVTLHTGRKFEPEKWNPCARRADQKLTPQQKQQIEEFEQMEMQKAIKALAGQRRGT